MSMIDLIQMLICIFGIIICCYCLYREKLRDEQTKKVLEILKKKWESDKK